MTLSENRTPEDKTFSSWFLLRFTHVNLIVSEAC